MTTIDRIHKATDLILTLGFIAGSCLFFILSYNDPFTYEYLLLLGVFILVLGKDND